VNIHAEEKWKEMHTHTYLLNVGFVSGSFLIFARKWKKTERVLFLWYLMERNNKQMNKQEWSNSDKWYEETGFISGEGYFRLKIWERISEELEYNQRSKSLRSDLDSLRWFWQWGFAASPSSHPPQLLTENHHLTSFKKEVAENRRSWVQGLKCSSVGRVLIGQ
jgi:hypothetical protein